MQLVKPNVKYEESFRAGFGELDNDSDRDAWIYLGPDYEDFFNISFQDYVDRLIRFETDPPSHFVCGSTYWAVEGDEIVGRIGLRHELNDFLRRLGGHIGYIVRPSWRKRGVATAMVEKLLATERAKAIGSLLLTCDEGNVASEKTIVKNGGHFESLIEIGDGKPKKKRYWIHVHTPQLALNQIEAIVFDLDGVLTKVVDEEGKFLWQKNVESDLGITSADVESFFRINWRSISIGGIDTLKAIQRHFETHGIHVPAKDFLTYWHENDSNVCDKMLTTAERLRNSGYKIYLGTNQEKYRIKHIWENLRFCDTFNEMFPSCFVGYEKPEHQYFQTVQSKIGNDAQEILFIDDTLSHINAAKACGWNAYLHKDYDLTNAQLFEFLLAKRT